MRAFELRTSRQTNKCRCSLGHKEMELSIYKFLVSRAKKQPQLIELGVDQLTNHSTINACQVTVKP